MKLNRDFFLPSLTTVILTGMGAFLSCSHQWRNVSNEEESEEVHEASTKTLVEETDTILLHNSQPEIPSVENTSVTSNNKADETTFNAQPNTTNIAVSQQNTEKQNFRVQLLKIPKTAFRHRSNLINRFYFVRSGDSPKRVAELIFGNPANSRKLRVWNPGSWKIGQMILYQSAKFPDDPKMASFYYEEQIAADVYRVKKGDWLSKIAYRTLGSSKSWSEIAIMNKITSPDTLRVGYPLQILPRELVRQAQLVTQEPVQNPAVLMPSTPSAPLVAETLPQEQAPRTPLNLSSPTAEPNSKSSTDHLSFKSYLSQWLRRLKAMLGRKENP